MVAIDPKYATPQPAGEVALPERRFVEQACHDLGAKRADDDREIGKQILLADWDWNLLYPERENLLTVWHIEAILGRAQLLECAAALDACKRERDEAIRANNVMSEYAASWLLHAVLGEAHLIYRSSAPRKQKCVVQVTTDGHGGVSDLSDYAAGETWIKATRNALVSNLQAAEAQVQELQAKLAEKESK